MKLPSNCPTRDRVVQGDIYAENGMEDYAFPMPRPFVAEDFAEIAAKYECDPKGMANTMNQVLNENLGNNLAQRIKAIAKRNAEAGEDDELEALPGDEELAAMVEAYDFSGVRATTGGMVGLSPLAKALRYYARQVVRHIFKENGYRDLAAPVTVAKKGEEPKAGQVSFDTYEEEVEMLAEGEGMWADNPDYAKFREEYVVSPAEAKVAADEKATTGVAVQLGMFN